MSAFVHRAIARAQDRGWIVWAVECRQNQCLIDNCGFDESNVEVDFGWRFAQQYQGQGLGTEAAQAVMDYGMQHYQFPRIVQVAYLENIASIRIIQKIGMVF
jgi:ribosomal-protein-alanine N-acetyltransferase